MTKFSIVESGNISRPAPADLARAILQDLINIRSFDLDSMPSHEEGLDLERVDAFFEQHGLQTAPTLVLCPEEVPILRTKLAAQGYTDSRLDNLGIKKDDGVTDEAYYMPIPDIIVAIRRPDQNIIKLTSMIVHDKAHSTSQYNALAYAHTDRGVSYAYTRVGNSVDSPSRKRGRFAEEGFASLMAVKFVREELGLPHGLWPDDRLIGVGANPGVPPEYTWPNNSGGAYTDIGAMPAYGFELIDEHLRSTGQPSLLPSLIKARISVDGLREVAKAINGIQPELYRELNLLPENPQAFAFGLQRIQSVLQA